MPWPAISPLPGMAQPVLDINEPAQVAAFIADWLAAQRAQGSFRR
ncbi:molybdopterin-guanine dinucleotide biosynthesis protein MobB [Cronobacter sakazakii]|nr:molybdopterin-guanine dinucleotide biosynthesis protein MobB [Cronobacter sakazakii]